MLRRRQKTHHTQTDVEQYFTVTYVDQSGEFPLLTSSLSKFENVRKIYWQFFKQFFIFGKWPLLFLGLDTLNTVIIVMFLRMW